MASKFKQVSVKKETLDKIEKLSNKFYTTKSYLTEVALNLLLDLVDDDEEIIKKINEEKNDLKKLIKKHGVK